MTGWIKMGTGLRDHPKVVRMAGMLKSDCLRVVGALHAVWSVFDEQSPDGQLEFYTLRVLDDKIGWRGFGKAMQAVGWLEEDESGLHVPEYEEHNGPTAKRRASDAKRKAMGREEQGDTRTKSQRMADDLRTEIGKMSASNADTPRTRGEEEEEFSVGRKESSPPVVTPAGAVCRALRQAGIPGNPSHPTLLELLDAGATLQHFVDAAPKAAGKRDPFAYLLGVVRGQIADAATLRQTVAGGQDAQRQDAADWRETKGGVNGMAAKVGLQPWDEIEPWADFKRRVEQRAVGLQREAA